MSRGRHCVSVVQCGSTEPCNSQQTSCLDITFAHVCCWLAALRRGSKKRTGEAAELDDCEGVFDWLSAFAREDIQVAHVRRIICVPVVECIKQHNAQWPCWHDSKLWTTQLCG